MGAVSAHLYLQSSPPVDELGPYGGRLGDELQVQIDDLTQGSSTLVAAGTPRQLAGCHDLGALAGLATCTYRFSARFPNGGIPPSGSAGDNAYKGSATSAGETWILTEPRGVPCRPAAVTQGPRQPGSWPASRCGPDGRRGHRSRGR